MAVSDGNGWVECTCGSRHWGRFGAAGLLLVHSRSDFAPHAPLPDTAAVLLQHRAQWSHEGGTWGLPGGARDSHEDVVTTALRETWEETGIDAAGAELWGVHRADHVRWSYTTVLMRAADRDEPRAERESMAVRWVPVADVADLPLHPGFAQAWPVLRGPRTRLVVDVANVMGSRPDGWWRDRALGAQRLVDELSRIAGVVRTPGGSFITLVMAVVEGDASHVVSRDSAVLVTAATPADPRIVQTAEPGDVVVTADAELAALCRDRGAEVLGPRWLLGEIGPS